MSSHLWEDTSGVYNACRSDVLSCDKNDVVDSDIAPVGVAAGVDKDPTTCSRSLKFKMFAALVKVQWKFPNYLFVFNKYNKNTGEINHIFCRGQKRP